MGYFIFPDFSNSIEGFYSILLSLILITALILVTRVCPENWKKRLSKIESDAIINSQENYQSLKEYLTTSFLDNLLLAFPGIFLIIGLSGTFISLGLVLANLQSSLVSNQQDLVGNIQETLHSLGAKFKISLWGIFFNLVYRLPYYNSANELDRLIKQGLRNISAKKQANEIEAQSKQNRLEESTTTFQTNLIQKISDSNGYLSNISSAMRNFDSTVNILKDNILTFSQLITSASTSLKDTTASYASTAVEFNKSVIAFESKSTSALQKFTTVTSSFDENIRKSFSTFSESVNSTLNRISTEFATSNRSSSVLISNTLKEIQPLMTTLNSHLTQMNTITSDLEAVLRLLDGKIALMDASNANLTDSINNNIGTIATMVSDFEDLISFLHKHFENQDTLNANLSDIKNSVNKNSSEYLPSIVSELRSTNDVLGKFRNE